MYDRRIRRVSIVLPTIAALAALTLAFAASPAVLRAAGRGAPRLALADGRPVAARASGAPDAGAALASGRFAPRAATLATLVRGSDDALVATFSDGASGLLATWTRDVRGAFAGTVAVLPLAEAADLVAAGDFDADGRVDVVTAARGGHSVWLWAGDGAGGLAAAGRLVTDAPVTALAAGELDMADGLADLAVGVSDGRTHALLLHASTRGAFRATAQSVALPAAARAIAFGAFTGTRAQDVAVAAGSTIVTVRGQDGPVAPAQAPARAPAVARSLVTLDLGAPVTDLAAGRFVDGHGLQLAALVGGDAVLVALSGTPAVADRLALGAGPDARLAAGKLAAGDGLDLLVTDPAAPRVRVLAGAFRGPAAGTATLALDAAPAAALALRTGPTGLADLVVFADGIGAPVLAPQAVASIFTVNATADAADANPGDGVCDTGSGTCTLRAALQEANALAGADTIEFALGAGTPSITLASALPALTDAVTIAGDTGGATRVEINANSTAGPGLSLAAGSSGSRLRALVINRAGTGNPGVRVDSANNTIEGCYVGTDSAGGSSVAGNAAGGVLLTGSGATGNLVGGTSAAARNVISHNATFGVKLDAGAAGNRIVGNYIGTNAAGSAANANTSDGVLVQGGANNNRIGEEAAAPGTAPGNVISGNSSNGVNVTGSGTNANTVAGNLIGTQANGTSGLANPTNNVFLQNGAQSNVIGGASAASRNVISSSSISSTEDGVEVSGTNTNNNAIKGNYIGVDITGATALANAGNGVYVTAGATGTIVGGDTATPGTAPGNVISGNSAAGVYVQSSSTTGTLVQGNLIGLNAAGNAKVANGTFGVNVDSAGSNTIGGATAGLRNVISGHSGSTQAGVEIKTGSSGNTVAGNYIGTDVTGTVAIANYNGVRVVGSSNTIGGNAAAPGTPPGNVISGNGNDGIFLNGCSSVTVAGNLVGTNAAGTAALRNTSNGVELGGGAQNNTIGGATAAARNVITATAGSFGGNVSLNGTNTRNNTVAGNYIGTDITGTVALNNSGDGVIVKSNASANTIGGLTATPGTPPGNLISGHTGGSSNSSGVQINGSGCTNNLVQGNLVGTDATGKLSLTNRRAGVLVYQAGAGNTIGGAAAGAGNVVSGNSYGTTTSGIEIYQSSNSVVKGNWAGVDITGNARLANGGDGILLTDGAGFTSSSGTIVGGTTASERNVASGNNGSGIKVSGAFCTGNTIAGNYAGVGADGVTALGNALHGVWIASGTATNTVGGTTGLTPGACTGACNLLAFNTGAGLRGDGSGLGNALRGNAITGNGALGIDLGPAGVNPNDAGDPDTGFDNLQNFPVITDASWDGTNLTVKGTLNTNASTSGLAVEVFANSAADASGYGQGKVWLGTASGIATDASGNAAWQLIVPGKWRFLSATAVSATGNTSEFALDFDPVYPVPDSDGDGYNDTVDCAPADPTVWAAPAEVTGLVIAADGETLQWVTLASQAGPATAYDVLRGDAAQFPVGTGAGETCLASALAATSFASAADPAPGQGTYYLVRGRNACGTGTYGTTSAGAPRTTTACP